LAEAWFGIGITLEKEAHYKEALQHFKRAVLLEPENLEFLLVLAECEYRLGHVKEAEDIYVKMVDLDPGMMEAWLDWSLLKYAEGEISRAAQLIYEAISYDPSIHQYHYRLVVYLYELGRIQEAHKHLELALMSAFDDHFLIFEIAPKLKKVNDILQIIDTYRLNEGL
jgi:tetratricopeptide (TPR) repeat protein